MEKLIMEEGKKCFYTENKNNSDILYGYYNGILDFAEKLKTYKNIDKNLNNLLDSDILVFKSLLKNLKRTDND